MVKQDPGQKPIEDAGQQNDPLGPNLNPFKPWGWSERTGWNFYPVAAGCGQQCG